MPAPIPQYNRRHSCFACHKAVLNGELDSTFSSQELTHWKGRLTSLTETPSLAHSRNKFREDWMVEYLINPYAIRSRLGAEMPRMKISREEAVLLASFFAKPEDDEIKKKFPAESRAKGKKLIEEKGCLACHQLFPSGYLEYNTTDNRTRPATIRLAPDLKHVKDRMSLKTLQQWLKDPEALSPGTLMPDLNLSQSEIEAISSYLFSLPELTRVIKPGVLPEIKPLDRKISFAEVNSKIFDKVCRHCHYDPILNSGRGGPGNTGGFGYAGVGLDLSTEQAIKKGLVDPITGKHISVIASTDGLLPRLVQVLLARHVEQGNSTMPGITGMPLGLPPIPMDDIKLLYTWCIQQP